MPHHPIHQQASEAIFGVVDEDTLPVMPTDHTERRTDDPIRPQQHHQPDADHMPLVGMIVAGISPGDKTRKGLGDQDIIFRASWDTWPIRRAIRDCVCLWSRVVNSAR